MSIGEGQALGNYRVLKKIGTGGMGAVFLAEHPLIGKKVALKVIHQELAGNKEVVGRFFQEAKAVNKIGSEHIVEIHDFGQSDNGEHFFIMEYLEGQTLADVLTAAKVLDVQRTLHICAQIANGLAAAHACGIIHRDLKPDNIMLVPRMGDPDFVKVLDFGLAKMFADAGASKLTAQGVVLGTPQFMSPEACESRQEIDHRADIYSLGVLMFQMLTGQVPFDGESMGEILVKHVTQPPPAPRGLNPAVPPAVEQIVLRCLAKQPDARFATMKDVREALLNADSYLASSPPVMPSSGVSDPAAKTMFLVSGGGPQQALAAPAAAASNGSAFPLRPPPPSLMGAPGIGGIAPSEARTAFMGAVNPADAAAVEGYGATAAHMPLAAGGVGAANATAIVSAQDVEIARRATAVPGMHQPMPVVNSTMIIGTPEGYSDKPPKKSWPMVVAVIAILAVGGGVAAAVILGGGSDDSEVAANDSDQSGGDDENRSADDSESAGDGNAGSDEAGSDEADRAGSDETDTKASGDSVKTDDAVKKPAIAVLTLNTDPSGADVFDSTGKKLGTTPTHVEMPNDGKEHTLVFKHKNAKDRDKTITVTGDTELTVELEALDSRTAAQRNTTTKTTTTKTTGTKTTGTKTTGTKTTGTKTTGKKSGGKDLGEGIMTPDI